MRALALASILALTLAACGDKPAGAEAADAAPVAETSALAFDAGGLPKFKPGLWEVSSREPDGEIDAYQQCMGEEANAEMREAVMSESEGCTKQVSRAGGALVVSGVCEQHDVRTEMRLAVRGTDTRSSMTMKMKVQNLRTKEAPSTMEMKVDGRWVGACPAGVAPGERVGKE